MKLLACTQCSDIFNLRSLELKTCRCGSVGGMYLADGDNVAYFGEPLFMGMNNNDLIPAIRRELLDKRDRVLKASGFEVEAWTFPWHYRKFIKTTREKLEGNNDEAAGPDRAAP